MANDRGRRAYGHGLAPPWRAPRQRRNRKGPGGRPGGGELGWASDLCRRLRRYVRIGGAAALPRKILVDDPFGGEPLHELEITDGAVATSGIGRRAWLRSDGSPAHHLLDPGSGQPAFTGIVQVTALAPIAQLAEVLAKTALLRGPEKAARELPYGGVLVFDDRSVEVVRGPSTSAALTIPWVARLAA